MATESHRWRDCRRAVREEKAIRILFVAHAYRPPRGGVERHLETLIQGLRSAHTVALLLPARDPRDEEYAVRRSEEEGIAIYRINHTFRYGHHLFHLYDVHDLNRAAEEVLEAFRPDLVHVHHLTGLSTGILASLRRRGVPVVLTLHDFWLVCPRGQRLHPDGTHCATIERERCLGCMRRTWPHLFPPGEPDPLTRRAEQEMLATWDDRLRELLNGVDRIIVPSRFYREEWSRLGAPPEKIVVIPHGLPGAAFAALERPPRPEGKLRVGYVGTVIPSKGVHILLRAAAGLGDRLEIHIHGDSPPYHEDRGYRQRLEKLVPEDVAVTFHGPYRPEELPGILSRLDVLVVPSIWYEAFAFTVREGFLAGLPVVAADIGGLREALAGGRGLLFRPGDPEDLRLRLLQLLEEPDLRDRFRGRPAWVRTPEEMLSDTLRVYEEARRDRPPPPPENPFFAPWRHARRRAARLSRPALLQRLAAGLEKLAAGLGVDPGPVALLRTLAEEPWELRERLRAERAERDWLKGDRVRFEETVRWLEEELRTQARVMKAEIAWLRETVAGLKREREALHREVEAFRNRHLKPPPAATPTPVAPPPPTPLQELLRDLQDYIENLQAQLVERNERLQALAEALRDREEELNALRETHAANKAYIERLHQVLRAKEEHIGRVEGHLERVEAAAEARAVEVADQSERLVELEEALRKAEPYMARLHEEIRRRDRLLARLERECRDQKEALAALERQASALRARVEALSRSRLVRLATRLARLGPVAGDHE